MCDTFGYLPPDDDAVYRGRRRILNAIDTSDDRLCDYPVSVDPDTGIATPCEDDEWLIGSGRCHRHTPETDR